MDLVPIGVVTVSDRASRGLYEDKGGPGIEAIENRKETPVQLQHREPPTAFKQATTGPRY